MARHAPGASERVEALDEPVRYGAGDHEDVHQDGESVARYDLLTLVAKRA